MSSNSDVIQKFIPCKKKCVERYYANGRFKETLLGKDLPMEPSLVANALGVELTEIAFTAPGLTERWKDVSEGKEKIEKAISLISGFKKLSTCVSAPPITPIVRSANIEKVANDAIDYQVKLREDLLLSCRVLAKSVQVHAYKTLGVIRAMQKINTILGNPVVRVDVDAENSIQGDAGFNNWHTPVIQLGEDSGDPISRMSYQSVLSNLYIGLLRESDRLEAHRKKTKNLPLSEADVDVVSFATEAVSALLNIDPTKPDDLPEDLLTASAVKDYVDYMWRMINFIHKAVDTLKPGLESLSFKPVEIEESPKVKAMVEELPLEKFMELLNERQVQHADTPWFAARCVDIPGTPIVSIHNFTTEELRNKFLAETSCDDFPSGKPNVIRRPIKLIFED